MERPELVNEHWKLCARERVVLAFLRAEWDKWPLLMMLGDRGIVDNPDLKDPVQNNTRASLLWHVRAPLLELIPADTCWFEVKNFSRAHCWQLHAINFPDWNSPDDMNELEKVAIRKPEPLRVPVNEWASPILWGHSKSGPFTVLEGNHRMCALASQVTSCDECAAPVFIGISTELCRWHHPDAVALRRQGWVF